MNWRSETPICILFVADKKAYGESKNNYVVVKLLRFLHIVCGTGPQIYILLKSEI